MKSIFNERPYLKWGQEHEIGCSNGGEDNFVINYFREKNEQIRYLVDIGAADGITGSNSYRLISEFGWKATLIEPLNTFYNYLLKLHKDNKNVEIFNFACDNEEQKKLIKYRSFDEAMGLTSLVCDWENSQFIETKKFDTLITNKKIDFLSLDCEGKDLDIIKDINFEQYDIKIICSEKSQDNADYNKEMLDYLVAKSYDLVTTTHHNFIFVKK